jgi:hypothetical protein
MRLPNASEAFVEEAKLTAYLLNRDHPHGASKARAFLRFGYRLDQPEVLAADLLYLARTCDAVQDREGEWGMQYAIIGTLDTPTGEQMNVRTVWQIDAGSNRPRFITARPLGSKR